MSEETRLRVALDLSGPREPLGNGMELLARSLGELNLCDVVRFASARPVPRSADVRLWGAALSRSSWRRSRGRAIDGMLPPVDVIHVAGLATPPTRRTRVLISVDDLRPLRDETKGRQRVVQLQRAAHVGAQLVASSNAASHEVQRALGLSREQVVIVAPAISWERSVVNGSHLVVNLTGRTDLFLRVASSLIEFTRQCGSRVVVLASKEAIARIRPKNLSVTLRARTDAAAVLEDARAVVHLSDGARFPSFAIAALAAGVPTCATSTNVNRELLDGATMLVDESDKNSMISAIEDVWSNEARRSVLAASGLSRAADFSPNVAAQNFNALYRDLVRHRIQT